MRNMAAAEHAVHALLSKPAHNARHSNSSQHCNMGAGRRTVYPEITHTAMFTKTQEIVSKMLEIAHELQAATTA